MASFSVPLVCANADSWGPPESDLVQLLDTTSPTSSASNSSPTPAAVVVGNLAKYAALPYAPFGRSDRLGRAADFSSSNRVYQQAAAGGTSGGGDPLTAFQRRGARDGFGLRRPTDSALAEQANVEGGGGSGDPFLLVDTTKTVTNKRFVNPSSKRRQHSQRLRQINARRQQSVGGAGTASSVHLDRMTAGRGGGRMGGRGGRGGGRMGGRGGRGAYYQRVDRQPSVAVQADWTLLEEIDLSKLTKNLTAATTVPVPQDILWCGFLDPYNDAYDKVSARQPVPLKRMENKEFYPVTAQDDPVLEKLAIDGEAGNVYVTDAVLAHLMTCSRSVQPWDLVIQKLPGGTLFLDKRDGSAFDFLTVQETAYQPPTDTTGVNTPERLGLEATVINQNFSQQILKKSGRKQMDLPNPFFDEEDANGMEPASVAFRYRKFPLDDKVTVVCRTELHGIVKKTQYMTAFCLNEYIPIPVATDGKPGTGPAAHNAAQAATVSTPQLPSWREKMDAQRGAVLATELKNNSFKLAKWTAQSLLAGADQMKIGFVSRVRPQSAAEHVMLGTQFYRPTDFAQQITLQEGQLWSMVRTFVALLQKQPDTGKFVLMRHPNKAVLHLYKVPPETFEDEE